MRTRCVSLAIGVIVMSAMPASAHMQPGQFWEPHQVSIDSEGNL